RSRQPLSHPTVRRGPASGARRRARAAPRSLPRTLLARQDGPPPGRPRAPRSPRPGRGNPAGVEAAPVASTRAAVPAPAGFGPRALAGLVDEVLASVGADRVRGRDGAR